MIERDPAACAAEPYDLVVVGGGVYGILVTLEAARRGLRPLLLERACFGGATSACTLRIVHGGFRYVQSLDFRRVRESAREQRWWLETFPELVRPLPCLLPLDGRGPRRPAVVRAALALYRSAERGAGLPDGWPRGAVLDLAEAAARVPALERRGLEGGLLWHDAVIACPARLFAELLRWACGLGARALEFVEACSLLVRNGAAAGVGAVDRRGGTQLRFRAPVVVNCAGPWCGELARRFDREVPGLFRPSLGFNVVVRSAPPAGALAVGVPAGGAGTYFVVPADGGALVGTAHAPWSGPVGEVPVPPAERVAAVLAAVRRVLPGWALGPDAVEGVCAGWLPAVAVGSVRLARRPRVVDHASFGGPAGLVSVSGVKLTTARAVAERAVRAAAARCGLRLGTADGARPAPVPAGGRAP